MGVKNKKTTVSGAGCLVGKHRTSVTMASGLGLKVNRIGAGRASKKGLRHCHTVLCRATIAVLAHMSECGLG